MYNISFSDKIESDFTIDFWNQPESFFNNLSVLIKLNGKTDGWNMGNPYLNNNVAAQLGLSWNLVEK
jgi:hypothetical protein